MFYRLSLTTHGCRWAVKHQQPVTNAQPSGKIAAMRHVFFLQ